MDIVLTVMLVISLWVAAVAFGRDPRVGGDWRPSTDRGGRPRAPGLSRPRVP
jgi:hypothetical protein